MLTPWTTYSFLAGFWRTDHDPPADFIL